MRAKAFKYPDIKNRTAYFRGYIESYNGATRTVISCDKVRHTEARALRDANKLIKELNK